MASPHNPNQNHLLAALPTVDFERLAPHLELVPMRLGDILYEPGDQMQHAYFPTTSIVSLHYVMESGASSESAGVGNEDVVGISLFMGGDTTPSSAVVQTAGHAYRLTGRLLKQEFQSEGPMQGLLLRYTQALITQMFQTAACNRHHSVEQQLCRWLLLTLDRMASNDLVMTQELVASMLGVRREGITQAAGKLQEAGFIRYRRGHISALQRAGLEQHACECYAVVKKELGRLLSDVRHRCALPLLRDRRGVCGGRGRPGPLRRGPRADTRRPRRGAAAGARSGVALVRPRRPSRPGRCTGHGRLAPRRGLLAGCLSAHRRPRPLRPGAPATLLRTTPFALERIEQLGEDQLVYRFAKPLPDGRTELRLTPLELIERLAALIPPPRLHRHRPSPTLPRLHTTSRARPRASSGRCCSPASTRFLVPA